MAKTKKQIELDACGRAMAKARFDPEMAESVERLLGPPEPVGGGRAIDVLSLPDRRA